MQFGTLICNPVSVAEVIDNPDFDNQHVAVHGIIFHGEGCEDREILFLPKEGPFDGVPVWKLESLNREKNLLIEQPNLFDDFYNKLGAFAMCGSALWNVNAILVGRIKRCPESSHPVRIGDLWLLVAQSLLDVGAGEPCHTLSVSNFPQKHPPQLPWSGIETERNGQSVIDVYPS